MVATGQWKSTSIPSLKASIWEPLFSSKPHSPFCRVGGLLADPRRGDTAARALEFGVT